MSYQPNYLTIYHGRNRRVIGHRQEIDVRRVVNYVSRYSKKSRDPDDIQVFELNSSGDYVRVNSREFLD